MKVRISEFYSCGIGAGPQGWECEIPTKELKKIVREAFLESLESIIEETCCINEKTVLK